MAIQSNILAFFMSQWVQDSMFGISVLVITLMSYFQIEKIIF